LATLVTIFLVFYLSR